MSAWAVAGMRVIVWLIPLINPLLHLLTHNSLNFFRSRIVRRLCLSGSLLS